MIRVLVLVWIPLAILGCSESEPRLEFAAVPLSPEEWQAWSRAGVKSAAREITVRRTMRTPSACRTLSGAAAKSAGAITLRVMSREDADGDCDPAEDGLFGYTAVISGVRPGRYELRVVHVFADLRRPPETVLQHSVLVED